MSKSSENRTYSRGKVDNVIYNDRCGYAIIFYDPIYDLDTKIAPLKVSDLPYTIPLLRKNQRNLKPAGKPIGPYEDREVRRPKIPGQYEAAEDFIHRKIIERKMDEVREACANIRHCYQKAEKFDLKRREAISPRLKSKLRGKASDEICDVLVDDVMQNVDYVFERNLEEKGKTQRKLALAALRRAAKAPKPIEKIHVMEANLPAVKEEDVATAGESVKPVEKITGEKLNEALKRSETKIERLPVSRTVIPTPPRRGLQNHSALQRRHMETMSQRAADALLFEMTYGRTLRRLKNEIRRIKETYG